MIKERITSQKFNGVKPPRLKGHAKITLHNCRTGKNEIIEADNIITNAVKDIFGDNYLGGIDYEKLTPIWSKWYGGVIAYENAHPTVDPDAYFMQDSTTNKVTAHAGDVAPSSAAIVAEDLTRGAPVRTIITDNSVKQVWEWGSQQGNGLISALSLCHKDIGNAGLGGTSSAFESLGAFSRIDGFPSIQMNRDSAIVHHAQYDDNHGLAFYIGDEDSYFGNYSNKDTYQITVYIKRLAYSKAGLFDTTTGTMSGARVFTLTTPIRFWMQPSYYFDATTKQLWLFTNITGTGYKSYTVHRRIIQYCIIDCENEALVNLGTVAEPAYSGTFEADTDCLAPVCMKGTEFDNDKYPCYINIPCDGVYIYFPTSSGNPGWYSCQNTLTGYIRFKLSDHSDQTLMTLATPITSSYNRSGVIGGGFVVFDGLVINGENIYKCAKQLPAEYELRCYSFNQQDKAATLAIPIPSTETLNNRQRYIYASKFVNTSLLNLQTPISKDSSKSLIIEYTLTEASTND